MSACPECGSEAGYMKGADLGPFCTRCKIVWTRNADEWEVRER